MVLTETSYHIDSSWNGEQNVKIWKKSWKIGFKMREKWKASILWRSFESIHTPFCTIIILKWMYAVTLHITIQFPFSFHFFGKRRRFFLSPLACDLHKKNHFEFFSHFLLSGPFGPWTNMKTLVCEMEFNWMAFFCPVS